MSTQITVTHLGGTPVFSLANEDPRFLKVFGATTLKNNLQIYFPAFYPAYQLVLRDIKALRLAVDWSFEAQKILGELDTYTECIQKRQLPANFSFKTTPYAHQIEGLVHLFYRHRAALFYACGLGKTKIVVDWQRATGVYPLILCPKIVLRVWAHEALRHGIGQEYKVIDALSKKEKEAQLRDASSYGGVVITYDSAKRYEEALMGIAYDAIVADESHCIKAMSSERTKVALRLSQKAVRRVIMSGTPSTGNPCDMYPQLRFLSPVFMPESYWHFRNRHCMFNASNKHIVTGYKNLDVLNQRVQLVALRRTKKECLDLPEQYVIDVLVSLYPAQRTFYNTLILSDEFKDLTEALLQDQQVLTERGLVDIANAAVLVNKLLQVTGGFVYMKAETATLCNTCEHMHRCVKERVTAYTAACVKAPKALPPLIQRMKGNAKLDTLMDKLDEILSDEHHKCIIWGQFHPELDWIEEALKAHWAARKEAFTLVRVDGRTTNVQKKAEQFNTDPLCRVYLGQVETGVGITLNAANYMIYYSLPWKLLAYDQSLDRNHRVGQRRDVTVFRLIGKGTIDVHVARGLSQKRVVSETLTAALTCSRCSRVKACLAQDRDLYDAGCKYQRCVTRPIARVEKV